jgi:hypothetical protein
VDKRSAADTASTVDTKTVDTKTVDTKDVSDGRDTGDTKPAARPAPPRKAAKPKASPGLTVTLAYAEGEWTVSAQQGARALAKPYVIKPTEALKMVGMIDVPGVHDAVEEIVTSARAQAEREAERLRTQLAEVEARLLELQVDEETAGSNGKPG